MDNWAVEILQSCEDFGYEELECLDFYSAVFSRSEAYQKYQRSMELPLTLSEGGADGAGTWRSVALADLPELVDGRNDAYVSACTFFPKKVASSDGSVRWVSTYSKDTANELCAFVLDIDRVRMDILRELLEGAWPHHVLPQPTYLTTSGTGVHLWYVLDWPVKVLTRWRRELEAIQDYLGRIFSATDLPYYRVENFDTDEPTIKRVDINLGKFDRHGLTQPYRVVGSLSKNEKNVVTAWRIGQTWDIDELGSLAGLEQLFIEDLFDMTCSLRAKEWEKWAQKRDEIAAARIASGSGKGHNPVFYPWFAQEAIKRSYYGDAYGSRYNVVMCLVIAARKDNASPRQAEKITRSQIVEVVKTLHENWNNAARKSGNPPIKWQECEKAIKAGYSFRGDCVRIRWSWMSAPDVCNWKHDSKSRRHGLSQEEHLADARDFKFLVARRRPSVLGGRPKGSGTKEAEIKAYAAEHPEANHSQIARALGVSRPTVIKWLREGE